MAYEHLAQEANKIVEGLIEKHNLDRSDIEQLGHLVNFAVRAHPQACLDTVRKNIVQIALGKHANVKMIRRTDPIGIQCTRSGPQYICKYNVIDIEGENEFIRCLNARLQEEKVSRDLYTNCVDLLESIGPPVHVEKRDMSHWVYIGDLQYEPDLIVCEANQNTYIRYPVSNDTPAFGHYPDGFKKFTDFKSAKDYLLNVLQRILVAKGIYEI